MELLKVDSTEIEQAAVAYSNTQLAAGYTWIQGKNNGMCSVLQKLGVTFEVSVIPCVYSNYFFCSYTSEKFFLINKLKFS